MHDLDLSDPRVDVLKLQRQRVSLLLGLLPLCLLGPHLAFELPAKVERCQPIASLLV